MLYNQGKPIIKVAEKSILAFLSIPRYLKIHDSYYTTAVHTFKLGLWSLCKFVEVLKLPGLTIDY